jgi:hypothetical protein
VFKTGHSMLRVGANVFIKKSQRLTVGGHLTSVLYVELTISHGTKEHFFKNFQISSVKFNELLLL